MSDLKGERIKSRRVHLGLTQEQLANSVGVSYQAVQQWESGRSNPKGKRLQALSEALHCTKSWIEFGADEGSRPSNVIQGPTMEYEPTKKVPIISTVEAGQWTECVSREYVDDATEYQVTTLNVSDSAFALRVSGDSMTNPHGTPSLPEGSLIIVEPHPDPDNGKIVVAMLEGSDEATVKRLQIDGGNRYLVPLNPKYPVMEINGNCRIVGYVKQVIQNL